MLTALEFINIITPDHDRISCDDDNRNNSLYSRNGKTWHGRCTRCVYLDIAHGVAVPYDFDSSEYKG